MAADPEHDTLVLRLLNHAALEGDEIFARFVQDQGERTCTWKELLRRAAEVATFLRARGVSPRETVFILFPLGPDLLAAFLGAMLARALPAFLAYPSSKVAPEVCARNLLGVLEVTGARQVLTTRALEGPLGAALGDARKKALLWIEEVAPVSESELEAIVSDARLVSASEVAFLQHSSGSTGLQKGVALSHRAVLNQVGHYAKAIGLDPRRDLVASWLPLYHDMGLIATFLMPLATGTRVVYMDPFRWVVEPWLLLEAIARHRATLAWLPNFAYVHMAKKSPRRAPRRSTSPRYEGS